MMEVVSLSGLRPSASYSEHHAAVHALVAVAGGWGGEDIDETPSGSLMRLTSAGLEAARLSDRTPFPPPGRTVVSAFVHQSSSVEPS